MVKVIKLYVGNLPDGTKTEDLQSAFEKYGKVEECDVLRNYGFVHICNEDEAKVAMESLNNSEFNGSRITVEISHSKGQCYRCGREGHLPKDCPLNSRSYQKSNPDVPKATKLFVGNLSESVTSADLRPIFEKIGKIEECDVLKNYGFVHMTNDDEAKTAVETLNGSEFMGTKIIVEMSKSRGQCYTCGRLGHWSKECKMNTNNRSGGGSSSFMGRFGSRYGADRFDRSFSMDRTYRSDRMRPYPDMYERRLMAQRSSDDYYRSYSDYYSGTSYDRDYDYSDFRTQDRSTGSGYNYMWSSTNPNTA